MNRSVLVFCAAMLVVTGPMAIALGNYMINDNASRPFDILVETGRNFGLVRQSDIVVTLKSNRTPEQLEPFTKTIRYAFAARNYSVEINQIVKPVGSIDTLVIQVGANRYGPYPTSNANAGIRTALAAQSMRNR